MGMSTRDVKDERGLKIFFFQDHPLVFGIRDHPFMSYSFMTWNRIQKMLRRQNFKVYFIAILCIYKFEIISKFFEKYFDIYFYFLNKFLTIV